MNCPICEVSPYKSEFDQEMTESRENWVKEQTDRSAQLREEKEQGSDELHKEVESFP